MRAKVLTLCLWREPTRILLGMKKRGFGAGRWNGFGGKVQENETIEEAARREMQEEASLDIIAMERVGVLLFDFVGDEVQLEVHVFRVDAATGEPTESEEMRPQWFDLDVIPFDRMWPDDKIWFQPFLAGKKFRGSFAFDGDDMTDHELEEVEEL